ncbi:MAG TPA: hypothetical protein VFH06_01130 [Candidatus Saccharimonadales bacterium]|nr:hypothetical protein [Candidatus Saccharimonadales bacterium]
MKKWKQLISAFVVALGLGGLFIFTPSASAVNVFDQCASNADAAVCKAQGDNATNMITIVINILLFVVGIIAVIMIIVGGIRYTLSNGNASQVKEAKDTILYSVIGLVIAIMSYAIVNFVLGRFIGA